MQNGVCFGCLAKAGHISKDCGKRLQCIICNKQHPSALHIKETTLKSLQVSVKADEHTGADPGSSATFCTENLLNKLNIRGKRTNILLRTMNQEQSVITYMANGIEVSALNENNFIALPEVYTQKSMPVDTDSILKTEELARWPYLSEIQIPKIKAEVELLIGNNAPKAIEPWEIINSRENGPYAVKTLLGWVVNGPLDDSVMTDSSGHQKVTVNRTSVPKLEDLIVQQYNHDFNEKLDDKEMSIEDKRFIKIAEQSITLKDGHYSLDLPFRKERPVMPNNYQVAEQRLIGLKRKFKRNETFRNEYTEFMEDVISNGHADHRRQDGKDLCRNKCSWDQEVPQAASEKWRKWLTGLDELEHFRVARSVKPDGIGRSTQAELHHFSDASDYAYGTTRSQSKMLESKRKASKNELGSQCISLDDLMKAEKAIVMFCQHQSYPEEMAKLAKTKFVGKGLGRNSTIYKLDPVLENGVLRVGGRLSKAAMPEEANTGIPPDVRGQVTHIRSDNGTNLVGAKRELQDAISNWNKEKIQNTMLQKGIQWTFNPPAASHHGEVWERLIRMVRQTLNSIAHEQPLDDEGQALIDYSIKVCQAKESGEFRPANTIIDREQNVNMT
ncbi:uncharacterized protein LOC132474599 [Gadus macrocephalus]|uniref:uncharacterized protein LOC132474599 n=1 Tax=Gadus macrocephalus TaxID=80720 RepID=UPI0028CB6292|nr:uncharacterized protein LOC132474599 [Gadus macrocephalus]